MDYSIGDFSLITRLSVKTLRYYHQEGLLKPDRVDPSSGYRYYRGDQAWTANLIGLLKRCGFSLAEIKSVLDSCANDADLTAFLHRKRNEIDLKIKEYRRLRQELASLAAETAAAERSSPDGAGGGTGAKSGAAVAQAAETLYLSDRFQGKYSDIGDHLTGLFRAADGAVAGPPFALYRGYETDDDPDIEACVPVKPGFAGGAVHRLPAGERLALEHIGPYETIGAAYERLFAAARQNAWRIVPPIREIYLKGPGRFFPVDPRRFRTRIEAPFQR